MTATQVITLGCRLNAFESEIIRQNGAEAGVDNTIVVNTCAVTAEAERQARQTIRRLKRQHPDARMVVTGCAAQLHPRTFADMPEVDQVLGNAEKLDPAGLWPPSGRGEAERIRVADIMAVAETAPHLIEGFEGRQRAFVQIQQGCDHRCTFCIIPFARGNNRSLARDTIIEQVRRLVDGGYKEIVLTGVDICSYGRDLEDGETLGGLVAALLDAQPELPRLRLSTLDPAAIDDTLLGVLADDERLMPHLHLSLQAMDDTVLKRMKRRHLTADVFELADKVRRLRPDVALGADLIAGFPTETDAMAKRTEAAVAALGLTHLHVFPFSERDGTPAARMPQVETARRKARAARLRELGNRVLAEFLAARIGNTARVLVETTGRGLSEHYVPVAIAGDAHDGEIVGVRITSAGGGELRGTRLS